MAEPVSTSIGAILGVISTAAVGAWAAFERIKRTRAETGAAVASSSADRAVAESQATVFELMKTRLEALEKEMQLLRAELQAERQHSRKMELHVYKLEGLLVKAGLSVPKLEE